MISKIPFIAFLLLTLVSCNDNKESSEVKEISQPLVNSSAPKQLNVSILLDLSDRLIQDVNPSPKERDIEIIKTITRLFSQNMKFKGTFKSKDKIKILFNPTPKDPNINRIAQELKVNLSTMDAKQKKFVYDTLDSSFILNISSIYDLTLASRDWVGSDIWRFFKNDVEDYCVDSDPEYRNILIILTDGYIYHIQSKDRIKNRTAFITGNYLEQSGFRKNSNWKKKFDEGDFGFINHPQDLKKLEVLILEVNPSAAHKNDEDIIRAYWAKWFDEMNIQKFQIYNTDLPSNTTQRIVNFFNQ